MSTISITIYSDSEFSPFYALLYEREIMEGGEVSLIFLVSSDTREKSYAFFCE
jgi:hypothetical protein